jgi:hypothetical protein
LSYASLRKWASAVFASDGREHFTGTEGVN